MGTVCLEEARRDPDFELVRQLLHRQHRRMLGRRARVGEQALVLDAAEIGAFEQLGREHHFRAFRRGLAYKLRHRADVGDRVVGEGELEGSDGELGH